MRRRLLLIEEQVIRIVAHVVLGIKVVVTNSLSSLYSETAEEWHPTKNGDLRADEDYR